MENKRRCIRCKNWKTEEEFGVDSFGRAFVQCPACRKYAADWILSKRKRFTPEQAEKWRTKKNERNKRVRLEAIKAYGGTCECCGETRPEFLAMDHRNGGGRQHRMSIRKNGSELFHWLKRHKWPKDFRLLCHNCNLSLGFYGYCPHQAVNR